MATDALVEMEKAMKRDGIILNDKQLACARINSPEGENYLAGLKKYFEAFGNEQTSMFKNNVT